MVSTQLSSLLFLLCPLESFQIQIKGSLLAVILSGKGGGSVETEKEIDQEEMPPSTMKIALLNNGFLWVHQREGKTALEH